MKIFRISQEEVVESLRYITIEDLMNNTPEHSWLKCDECGRWLDIGKDQDNDWKYENEMDGCELELISKELDAIAKGKGRGYSTCRHCKKKWEENYK